MDESATTTACPDCHALTDDLAAHQRWHSRLVRDIAIAVRQYDDARHPATAG